MNCFWHWQLTTIVATLFLGIAPAMGAVVHTDVSLTTGTTVTVVSVEPVAYLNKMLPSLPPQNAAVVRTLLSYPRDGSHEYWWPKGAEAGSYDGATTNIMVGPLVALRGEGQGRTFCCGLTLEVFYKTLPSDKATPDFQKRLNEFKRNWFCREIFSPGPEDALLAAGLGEKIVDHSKALPGDYVQLWRNNKSGHSVIFVNWVVDQQNRVIGLQYWSTQPKTGIAFNTEYFGDQPRQMDISKISVARAHGPS